MVYFGVNPSMTEPDDLDPTLTRVSKYASINGFDSWIMLNIYPQRKTNPRKMHREPNEECHQENIKQITRLLTGKNYTLWAT